MFSSTTAIVFCASDLVKASRNSWNQVKIAQQLLPPVTESVGLMRSDNKYIITRHCWCHSETNGWQGSISTPRGITQNNSAGSSLTNLIPKHLPGDHQITGTKVVPCSSLILLEFWCLNLINEAAVWIRDILSCSGKGVIFPSFLRKIMECSSTTCSAAGILGKKFLQCPDLNYTILSVCNVKSSLVNEKKNQLEFLLQYSSSAAFFVITFIWGFQMCPKFCKAKLYPQLFLVCIVPVWPTQNYTWGRFGFGNFNGFKCLVRGDSASSLIFALTPMTERMVLPFSACKVFW